MPQSMAEEYHLIGLALVASPGSDIAYTVQQDEGLAVPHIFIGPTQVLCARASHTPVRRSDMGEGPRAFLARFAACRAAD
jgi:hypothetical protein